MTENKELRPAGAAAEGGEVMETKIVGNLEWQSEVPDKKFTWEEAKEYAASLGEGWRLPTVHELFSLVDVSRVSPACSVFPACPQDGFWSSSAFAANTYYAWYVNFDYGDAYNSNVTSAYRVRCVREAVKEVSRG
jgi:hypothetical protein